MLALETIRSPILKRFAFILANLVPQMVARSREDILAARGVKPTLSPNLSVRSMGPFRSMGFVWVVSVDVQASRQLSTRSMGPYLGCTAGQAARQLSWLSLTLLCRLWPARLQPRACMRASTYCGLARALALGCSNLANCSVSTSVWSVQVLATVEALDVKRLLFIGVGCQVRRPEAGA